MRRIFPLLALLLAACGGEPVRDDHFANDVVAERGDPAKVTSQAVPVRIGDLGPSFDACSAAGTTRRVGADATLPVRAAPFETAAQTARIEPGHRFFVCARTHDQKWFGIVFDADGALSESCGVSSPVTAGQPYPGPCSSGWIASAFVKVIAGNDVPASPVEAADPAP